MIYFFGKCVMDEATRTLCRSGRRVSVEPKVFDLLAYLIEHRDRVVERRELLEALWAGVFVSETALSAAVKRARKAIGDRNPRRRLIETCNRRGYRLVAVLGTAPRARRGVRGVPLRSAGPSPAPRRNEMTVLKAALDDVLEGHGHVIALTGDASNEKTRLAERIAAIAGGRGAEVLWSCGWEGEGVPPLWAWVQPYRTFLARHSQEGARLVAGATQFDVICLCSLIADRAGASTAELGRERDSQQMRLLDSAASFWVNASRLRPLLVVLDELHGAQIQSVLLLRVLANRIRGERIFLLASWDETALPIDSPVYRNLAMMIRAEECRRIRVA